MNEELQNQTASLVGELITILKDTKQFTLEQAPTVIHELVLWSVTSNILTILLSSIIIYVSYKSIFKWSNQELDYGWLSLSKMICSAVGGVVAFTSGICIVNSTFNLLYLIVAPKLWLLSHAVSLLK
jgi:hypothetical protein